MGVPAPAHPPAPLLCVFAVLSSRRPHEAKQSPIPCCHCERGEAISRKKKAVPMVDRPKLHGVEYALL